MQLTRLALCALVLAAPTAAAEDFDHSHALWTEVLREHVRDDRFDYAKLKQDRSKLDLYLKQIYAVRPAALESWSRNERYAYWINVYNASAVSLVVSEYPVKSIKDIGGFFSSVWKKEFIPLEPLHPKGDDDALSLDDVEHAILRPRFEDARVHAAVNCASVGCPPLRSEAFVAERLDEQLDEQVRAWLADPRRNRYDRSEETIRVSEIFDWFGEDFERDAGSVEAWIAKYAPADEAAWLKGAQKVRRKYLDYSWKLNDTATVGKR